MLPQAKNKTNKPQFGAIHLTSKGWEQWRKKIMGWMLRASLSNKPFYFILQITVWATIHSIIFPQTHSHQNSIPINDSIFSFATELFTQFKKFPKQLMNTIDFEIFFYATQHYSTAIEPPENKSDITEHLFNTLFIDRGYILLHFLISVHSLNNTESSVWQDGTKCSWNEPNIRKDLQHLSLLY